ncbi:MAG: sulfatase-like hydrolase/transferase, partial [Planctomycetota bacterium]
AFLAERGTDTGNEKPPFFLDVGFYTTHRTGPIEPGSKVAGHNAPDWPLGDPRFVDVPPCLPDVPDVRKDFADYAAAVGRLDGYIGTVLGALDDAQLTDQTLVIITTDHGIAFPWMKCNLTAHGTGVMLLMAGPDQFQGGRVVDDAVSHLDVFPTVCDVLGLEHPDWLQGESTLPLLADDHTSRDRPIFAEVNYHARREPMRAVRTRRFSYIRRLDPLDHTVLGNIDDSLTKLHLHELKAFDPPPPAEQLFDLLHDPHERSDVADDPDYAPALAEMRERLDAWMRETNDIALQGPIDLPGYPTKATDTYSP